MTTHMLVTDTLPTGNVVQDFKNCYGDFDQYPYRRTVPGSPHVDMTDIWVRYNDVAPYLEKGSLEGFGDEHDSVWYPIVDKLPSVKPMVFALMAAVEGERLGGVLVTKLPPGGKILPHTDAGWHAAYYDKFYVPITAPQGSFMGFDDGEIHAQLGQAWWFDNSNEHWVENPTQEDRISMIVCIRTERFKHINKRRI